MEQIENRMVVDSEWEGLEHMRFGKEDEENRYEDTDCDY